MTVKLEAPDPDSHKDRHGSIECHGCEELGRPKGGVHYRRSGQRLTVSYELPEGWALQDCAVHCPTCANQATVQTMRQRSIKLAAPALERGNSGFGAGTLSAYDPIDYLSRGAITRSDRKRERERR